MARGRTENLKVPTSEEARKLGKKGGIASGEARRRKIELREIMEALLESNIKTKDGAEITKAEAICIKQLEKALKGDTKAFETVRDTAGQKPKDALDVNMDASPIVINNNVTE